MIFELQQLASSIDNRLMYCLVVLLGLGLIAFIANIIMKQVLVHIIFRALKSSTIPPLRETKNLKFIARLANIIPAIIFAEGIRLVPNFSETLAAIITNTSRAIIVLMVAMALTSLLSLINKLYQLRPDAHLKPIKGYVQVVKIIVSVVAAILIVAVLVDRSPVILLSGLGAMAAVLILVFQDTLLSLVASVQISSSDILRVGDWVEMPQYHADGDVIDIALHTVKVQNWDKTITTVPTRKFITESFKNWRGMRESGGRRIKRSIMIDQHSVRFLTADEKKRLNRFRLLQDYLPRKQAEINDWNEKLQEQGKEAVNTRRITNLGTFRAYVEQYLRNHPLVHQGMTMMVRQMAPTADGLPLEVYCFTNTVVWTEYEGIQSDIFDHLFSIIDEFGLRTYQHPSGQDVRESISGLLLKP